MNEREYVYWWSYILNWLTNHLQASLTCRVFSLEGRIARAGCSFAALCQCARIFRRFNGVSSCLSSCLWHHGEPTLCAACLWLLYCSLAVYPWALIQWCSAPFLCLLSQVWMPLDLGLEAWRRLSFVQSHVSRNQWVTLSAWQSPLSHHVSSRCAWKVELCWQLLHALRIDR